MVAMIEADAHRSIRAAGCRDQRVKLFHVARSGLLNEHVFAGVQSSDGHRRQTIVGRRDNDNVDIGMADCCLDVHRDCAANAPCDFDGSIRYVVGTSDQPGPGEPGRAFPTDETTPDDGDSSPAHLSPQVMPRSFGTMRRRV
jgi:hypothetical protein